MPRGTSVRHRLLGVWGVSAEGHTGGKSVTTLNEEGAAISHSAPHANCVRSITLHQRWPEATI